MNRANKQNIPHNYAILSLHILLHPWPNYQSKKKGRRKKRKEKRFSYFLGATAKQS
jgi:hypothetical protein